MTITFVAHDTPEPALYGAMASILARHRGVGFAHLPVEWHKQNYADACQHVTSNGGLVTSGLLWYERFNGVCAGKVRQLDDLLSLHGGKEWVIPLGPSQLASFSKLMREVKDLSVDYELIEVKTKSQGYQLNYGDSQEVWWRDSFGRLTSGYPERPRAASKRLSIALIGTYHDQLSSYPATLAALGDAADALGVAIETVFIPPQSPEHVLLSTLQHVDGVLLPGGSDMLNVAGQTRVAHYCLQQRVPVLGLCLGMQTMATAVIQQMMGNTAANLAEADPQAELKTFVPLGETSGHRLGDKRMTMRAGSQLAAVLGETSVVRYNHRFQLNPQFKTDLEAYGLSISGTDESGAIAEGIEYASHPFYLGVQGHPELSSTAERPHPLMSAFLQAAVKS